MECARTDLCVHLIQQWTENWTRGLIKKNKVGHSVNISF